MVSRAVVLKVGSPHQQHHLGISSKCRFWFCRLKLHGAQLCVFNKPFGVVLMHTLQFES